MGQHDRRFKANPVEVFIFFLISMTFVHSLYTLLYTKNGFHPTLLSPMASQPLTEHGGVASPIRSLASVDSPCSQRIEKTIDAARIRLKGNLCQYRPRSRTDRGIRSEIINQRNKKHATVFIDPIEGKYSTDYIPIEVGQNSIQVSFKYPDGNSFFQEVVVSRRKD